MSLLLPDGRPGRADVASMGQEKLSVMGEWRSQGDAESKSQRSMSQ